MCHDARRTADQVQALQNISLEVELRRRIVERVGQLLSSDHSSPIAAGRWSELRRVSGWLDELCPPPQSN